MGASATGEQGFAGLMVAMAAGIVLGVAMLIIIYKTIDGDISPGLGIGSVVLIMFAEIFAIHPPNPWVPGAVLVIALTLMAFFPYASSQLEQAELQAMDTNRLDRAYRALMERQDNHSARFEVAAALYDHGLEDYGIAVADQTLRNLPTDLDNVSNRSMRDMFRAEEGKLKLWKRAVAKRRKTPLPFACPTCKRVNPYDVVICPGCGRPYLLDLASTVHVKRRFIGRLVAAWAALAAFLVGAAVLSTSTPPGIGIPLFIVALAGVGFFLKWLFRKPKIVAA